MNPLHPLRAWLFALACLGAAAPAAAETALARVTGIYVELAPGVLSERRGISAEEGKPLVAEVRVPAHDNVPARDTLVRMNDIDAAAGDTVEVRLGEHGFLSGVRPAPAAIVRIETHGETQIAQIPQRAQAAPRAPLFLIPQTPAPVPAIFAPGLSPGLALTLSLELTPH
jgi:hypothetical protein